ncbi:DsbA family protein [Parvularcula lutaonensis]|uniref:DsbA family protein n=1 Tax=Parvularcula lutaonensis TaxID=491923 RepID=A0ABV7M8W9_9PROT|nr:DsbA family protein [Parvularcula lutaonensis]GGY42129.1 hypothetical protein GCM10007148_08470 [Parvularcula lutaonensis]
MTRNQFRLALIAAGSAVLAACGGGDDAASDAAEETAAPAAETSAEAPAETAAAQPQTIAAPEGSMAAEEMVIGDPDAPLTVIEYASVTCPGCAAFHERVFPTIKEEFVDTGKVKFVYREFPTPPERLAFAGFILARCAATNAGPEAYYGMVDALYKRQQSWVRGPNTGEELRNIAAQAGLAGEQFDQCFQREDIRDAIIENVEMGREAGLRGTPSFIIDGKQVDLTFDPERASEILQAEVDKRS